MGEVVEMKPAKNKGVKWKINSDSLPSHLVLREIHVPFILTDLSCRGITLDFLIQPIHES